MHILLLSLFLSVLLKAGCQNFVNVQYAVWLLIHINALLWLKFSVQLIIDFFSYLLPHRQFLEEQLCMRWLETTNKLPLTSRDCYLFFRNNLRKNLNNLDLEVGRRLGKYSSGCLWWTKKLKRRFHWIFTSFCKPDFKLYFFAWLGLIGLGSTIQETVMGHMTSV